MYTKVFPFAFFQTLAGSDHVSKKQLLFEALAPEDQDRVRQIDQIMDRPNYGSLVDFD